MRELLSRLIESTQNQQPVVYTALVETRGSTPQKAGAVMLVFADGSQVGTLGGGCVEAEVKRRAIANLKSGQRELMTFKLDSNYGWDDGLICGGRMSMLVDPILPGDDISYFTAFADCLGRDEPCTEAVVVQEDATPDRFLLDRTGKQLAARAENQLPALAVENLRDVNLRPRPHVANGISYLPQAQRCRLVIVGAGHVGQKVAELASDVGFRVWVADDRDDYCSDERFPSAEKLVVGPIENTAEQLEVDTNTFCIIVTRGHNHDETALFHLANTPARYVGMIGSNRKIKLIFEDLKRDGISEDVLRRVHAPVGFDIGSQTVPEIAISIVAELIAFRNMDSIPASVIRPSLLAD